MKAKQIKPIEKKPANEKDNSPDRYKILLDKAEVEVTIGIDDKTKRKMYQLEIPKLETGTRALLNEIREQLLANAHFSVGEITDQKSINEIKEKLMLNASSLLEEQLPGISEKLKNTLIGFLIQEMLGIGKIEFLISDPNLEEVVILTSKEPVRVYHKKHGWLETNIIIDSEEEINNYANIIGRRIGRQISVLTPLLDAHVITGDRANAVLYPISTKGNTITIRKFSRDPWTIIDLIKNNTVSLEVAALLWLAIEYEMNIIFSGGTASGKTVFLNSCMCFIPPNQRLISIEDTRELMLPEFLYWCPLVTRTPNAEGKGEVSMLDLLMNSLRMRPDRIILGEMRRQAEAEVLFEAMHTGHSVYATVHADTATETIQRLINSPLNIAPNLLKAVHLNVVMYRDRRRSIRRVLQVAELVKAKDQITANILYRFAPELDKIIKHNPSMSFFEEISRHTGMSQAEIEESMGEKSEILKFLIDNNLRSLKEIGKVTSLYYVNKPELREIIKKKQPEKIREANEL